MPVTLKTPVRRLSQAEFGELAYAVMGCIFEIHSDLGRFFDEKIYQRELVYRYTGVQLEVPIEVRHGPFLKTYYLDALVASGGLFEFKAVEGFTPRHRAQLLHYLLLAELAHGKLVNLRHESVEHEFVNTTLIRADRIRFEIAADRWNDRVPGAARFREGLTAQLRDWGTGLDLQLYEEALTYFCGEESHALSEVEVRASDHVLGHQKLRLAAPRVAFKLTAWDAADPGFESQARRLLLHTDLEAVLWANIGLKMVTFTTIS